VSKNIFHIILVDVGDKKNVIEFWCWWHSWNNGDRHLMRGVKTVTNISNLSPIIVANMEPNGISNLCFKAAIWLVIVGEYLIGWKLKSRMRIRDAALWTNGIGSSGQYSFLIGWNCQRISINFISKQILEDSLKSEWWEFYWRLMKKELWFLMDRKIGYSEWGRIDQRRYRCFRLVKKI